MAAAGRPLDQDQPIWDAMPVELRQSLRDYYQQCAADDDWRDGEPCIWLDAETKRCRHYEHRPSVCREFPVGGDDCREARKLRDWELFAEQMRQLRQQAMGATQPLDNRLEVP